MVARSAQSWASCSFVKILIVQTSFLGDVVLTTPVMVALRERYPEARFTWVTTPEAAALLQHDPWIDEVIPFDKNRSERSLGALIRKAGQLAQKRFDRAFALQRSWRTSLLMALSGIEERTGFQESGLSFLYRHRVQRDRSADHEVMRNLSLIQETRNCALRIVPKATDVPLNLGDSDEALAVDPATSVVLGVGSAWATKRWTVGGFIEVARGVVAQGMTPVLLGSEADQPRADLVVEEVPQARTLKLKLDDTVRFVSKCAGVVCHDSLLLHLASAFKRPTVAIFCSTVPEFGFGPWQNPRAKIVQVDGLSCKPCGRHGHASCPTGTWACARELPAVRVLQALDSVRHE